MTMQNNSLDTVRQEIDPTVPMSFTLGRKWFVCEVWSKQEFRAECALKALGYDAYAPRSRHYRKSEFITRRRQKIERPLFPGYCFVGFDLEREEWWRPVHTADGVRSVLSNNLIPASVHRTIIERIKRAEDAGLFDWTIPSATFEQNQDVEIMEGPFAGLIAKVKSTTAKKRIRLLLNGLMLDMDASNLSKVA